MSKIEKFASYFAGGIAALAMIAQAQEVKRCDGPGGKVTYAEACPPNTMASTVTKKGLSVTDSDKYQRETEKAFQQRHAQRQKTEASERAAARSAAAKQRSLDIQEEKMQREMKLKEDAAKRGVDKPKRTSKSKKKNQQA
jgi:hypothetical protein